ncbi:hypothetical protein [Pelagibacterium halotolerans]|uniref:hypothetical protein n=1 Tax=Pelagibacterium halotolerans TaxID=531813 RepID=UPI00384FFAC3
MVSGIGVGDHIYVCSSRVNGLPDNGKAFHSANVVDRQHRSIQIYLPGGQISDPISTKYAHKRIGACIVTLGDFQTEQVVLDPLAKSILQYCRLLFGDDSLVKTYKVRTGVEIRHIWENHFVNDVDHVIFVGHGSEDGEIRVGNSTLSPAALAEAMPHDPQRKWKFTFLCCQLGRAAFSKSFSELAFVEQVIAPFHSVHAAISSQFVQTFLVRNLLDGETPAVAFKNAAKTVPGPNSFRRWVNGELKGGRST